MRNEFHENDYEYDATVDALLAFLDLLPKDKVKMIDFDRYKTMMQTAAELKGILCENHEEGQLDIDICAWYTTKAALNGYEVGASRTYESET